MTYYPFWGAQRPHLYDILQRSADPEGLIFEALGRVSPWRGREVLEIGCGRGDFSSRISAEAACVVGTDADPRMIALAEERHAPEDRLQYRVADVERLPFPADSFDAVYALWAYFFGAGCEAGLDEVGRVLRPGGRLAIVQNWGNDELSYLWNDAEFRCLDWPGWFNRHGFCHHVVDTSWHFPDIDSAIRLVGYLWGAEASHRLTIRDELNWGFKAAIFHRAFEIRLDM